VSDDLDRLAGAANNRGLKLVRSRVRTPRKRGFGKVGLTDKEGTAVFGMDAKGPTATPDDVQEYLRKTNLKDWDASLDVAAPRRKRVGKARVPNEPANDQRPEPKPVPKPKPPPKPSIRDAKPSDAARLVELVRLLDKQINETARRKNLAALRKSGETPLVATLGREVVGLCGISARMTIDRDAPIGRISPLVIAEQAQGHGIGRMLLEAAEQWMREKGCKLVEVTSNDRLPKAHAFYRHMGYERTSIRYAKTLS
jgi:GNAT superfamily N-acetyltransferase